jgi:DNA-binding HxlR family transcriptional regulator
MSLKRKIAPETLCPISRAEEIVGSSWTVLVLRELFMGNHRFDEIQTQSGGTPQMIAARLKSLEADGMVARRPYRERPLRYEYFLTEKGEGFYSVVLALRAWGETWCKAEGEERAVNFTHKTEAAIGGGLGSAGGSLVGGRLGGATGSTIGAGVGGAAGGALGNNLADDESDHRSNGGKHKGNKHKHKNKHH